MARLTTWTTAVLLVAGLAAPVAAQPMDPEEEQRCVWQCLANSPGAGSRQYNDCVARMCMAREPAAPKPSARAVPAAVWKAGSGRAGEHYAGVEIPGAALTFLCRGNGTGMIGIGGIGGGAVEFHVDAQAYGLNFTVKNTTLLADVPPVSHVVRAMMTGRAVHVVNRSNGRSASFPLTGSGAAIRQALAGCGLRP